jgi:hypothetical protein
MSHVRFSGRSLSVGLVLTVILVVAFTLGATAQDRGNGEPVSAAPASVGLGPAEEEAVSARVQAQPQSSLPANGEAGTVHGKVTVVEEVELLPGPPTPNLAQYFTRYSADVFVPYDDDLTYNYGGAGCVYRTGGTYYADHTLQLPDGAEIDYLRIYFYDNDASNDASASLYEFDGQGGLTQIAYVYSSGTPGWSSVGSGFFSYFVDNTNQALALRLNYSGGSDGNLMICGVRLRYQYNLSTHSLPLILKQAHP